MSEDRGVLDEAPLFVRWNPDRSPYAIELKLDLGSAMSQVISRARDEDQEIGGLLYGTVPTPGMPILRIEDFLPVPGGAEHGRTYMLDPKQQESFAAIRWTNRKLGKTAIGFFRSNSRGGLLRPTLTDRSLASSQFKEGIAPVFLLDAKEPRTGVFFLARNGQLPDEPAVQDFRFDDKDFRSLPEIEPAVPSQPSLQLSPSSLPAQYAWAAALVAILLLAVVALWSLGRSGSSSPLDLTVTGANQIGRNQAVDISWNHFSSQIARAVDGTLTVTDGKSSQEYKLGRDELRLGAIHYQTGSSELKLSLALNMPGSTSIMQSVNWRAE